MHSFFFFTAFIFKCLISNHVLVYDFHMFSLLRRGRWYENWSPLFKGSVDIYNRLISNKIYFFCSCFRLGRNITLKPWLVFLSIAGEVGIVRMWKGDVWFLMGRQCKQFFSFASVREFFCLEAVFSLSSFLDISHLRNNVLIIFVLAVYSRYCRRFSLRVSPCY